MGGGAEEARVEHLDVCLFARVEQRSEAISGATNSLGHAPFSPYLADGQGVAPNQSGVGRSTESITSTSTGPLADASFRPSCS